MSCGNPHEVPCSEVLDRMYSYLDGEMDQVSYAQVRVHLDECGPCLREFGLEEAVKRLVHKHCGHEQVPAAQAGGRLAAPPGPIARYCSCLRPAHLAAMRWSPTLRAVTALP